MSRALSGYILAAYKVSSSVDGVRTVFGISSLQIEHYLGAGLPPDDPLCERPRDGPND